MSLPVPVPLDPPPGDPAALAELVSAVTGAAFRTGVLSAHLAGPAASAPGWLGADAAAATEQVGTVAGLARQLHGTLTAAELRLRGHGEVLDQARRRIAALRRAQEEDFAGLSARMVALTDPDAVAPAVEELRAAEADRRRAHAAAMAEVTADATATARLLAGGATDLGGTGAPGQEARVRAHLAGLLPGWGDGELTARARSAARELEGPVTAQEIDAIAREGLPYAGNAAYAGALLANLGVDGVRWLLTTLGQVASSSDVLAAWLATAFGAARPPESGPGPLPDVLDARYVDPYEPGGAADQVVFGLAAVLAAVPASAGGVRDGTAAAWGVQMLVRERRQGIAAVDRLPPAAPDPVEELVGRLAAGADPAAAVVLLADREAWDALLARSWDDDGGALSGLVGNAAGAGPAGGTAVRSGLEALGTGLSPREQGAWTVDRTTAARLGPALGAAVAAHAEVVTEVLGAAGAGQPLRAADEDALRGLGYLTLDADAAAAVQSAVDARTAAAPLVLAGTDPAAPAESIAVRSALVAAREYAQRLEHALDGYVAFTAAVDRMVTYDVTVRFPYEVVSRIADLLPGAHLGTELLGVVVDAGAGVLDADGSWELGPDEGLVFDRDDAADAAAALAPGADPAAAEQVARQARAAFDRTAELLGHPRPPEHPEPSPTSTADDPAELKKAQVERGVGHH